jgi:hypothetical protein
MVECGPNSNMKIAMFRDVTPCGLVIVWYKMEAVSSSETLISILQVIHRHMPKDRTLHIQRHENLKC